jgi:dynein heavy chain
MDDYDLDTAKRVCGSVSGLLSWTVAMTKFYEINREVLPLKVCLQLIFFYLKLRIIIMLK